MKNLTPNQKILFYQDFRFWIFLGPVIAFLIICFIPDLYFNWKYSDLAITFKERADTVKSIRDALIQICAGILAIIGIYLTTRRTKAMEEQNKINENSIKNENINNDRRYILEQYSKASELLMNKNISARLSGIYLFEKVMNDSKEYHCQVIELLTAYVREKRNIENFSPKDDSKENDILKYYDFEFSKEKSELLMIKKHILKAPVEEDIQAILTVLGRRKKELEKNLKFEINLSKVYLYSVKISYCDFELFDFSKSIIFYSECIGTIFTNTNCYRSHFEFSKLYGAQINQSKCKAASFIGSDCDKANFNNTNCTGSNFMKTSFESTSFKNTDCKFCNFKNSWALTHEQLLQAKSLFEIKNLKNSIYQSIIKVKPELFQIHSDFIEDIEDSILRLIYFD